MLQKFFVPTNRTTYKYRVRREEHFPRGGAGRKPILRPYIPSYGNVPEAMPAVKTHTATPNPDREKSPSGHRQQQHSPRRTQQRARLTPCWGIRRLQGIGPSTSDYDGPSLLAKANRLRRLHRQTGTTFPNATRGSSVTDQGCPISGAASPSCETRAVEHKGNWAVFRKCEELKSGCPTRQYLQHELICWAG